MTVGFRLAGQSLAELVRQAEARGSRRASQLRRCRTAPEARRIAGILERQSPSAGADRTLVRARRAPSALEEEIASLRQDFHRAVRGRPLDAFYRDADDKLRPVLRRLARHDDYTCGDESPSGWFFNQDIEPLFDDYRPKTGEQLAKNHGERRMDQRRKRARSNPV